MIFSFFEKIFMLEMNTPQSTMIQENKALALKFNDNVVPLIRPLNSVL